MRRLLTTFAGCCWLGCLIMGNAAPAWADLCFAVIGDPRPSSIAPQYLTSDLTFLRDLPVNPETPFPHPAFVVMDGDYNHTQTTYEMEQSILGSEIPIYFVLGNHDIEAITDVQYQKNTVYPTLPYIVRNGPFGTQKTTFSWEVDRVHLVMLNEYWNGSNEIGTDGDIIPALNDWLDQDLTLNQQPCTFVFAHEPPYPQHRHIGDSLDKYPAHRDAFWQTMVNHKVTTYFCGHTHFYSKTTVNGLTQVDVGACGGNTMSADGATLVLVWVQTDSARIRVYRAAYHGSPNYHVGDEWTVPFAAAPTDTPTETPFLTPTPTATDTPTTTPSPRATPTIAPGSMRALLALMGHWHEEGIDAKRLYDFLRGWNP